MIICGMCERWLWQGWLKRCSCLRTGKRTQWGLVMDGWNSMIRYYKNNFSDGFRQVCVCVYCACAAVISHVFVNVTKCVVTDNWDISPDHQDSIDLFLGNYSIDEADMTTPLHETKDWKFLTVRSDWLGLISAMYTDWLQYVLVSVTGVDWDSVILFNSCFPSPPLVAHYHGCGILHVYHLPPHGW